MKRTIVFAVLAVTLALSVPAMATQIEVTADPLWTATGLVFAAGDTVNVTVEAGDTWSWGNWTDAAGSQPWSWPNTYDRFLYEANHGELIGYIGADPYQGNWGNYYFNPDDGSGQLPGYIHIGEFAMDADGFSFVAQAAGTLWLGFNDDAVSFATGDNGGSLTVTVNGSTAPVPEPCTLALLGTGLAGAALAKRRRKV